jgi:hypothetical protein
MSRTWAEINKELDTRGTIQVGAHTLTKSPEGVAVTLGDNAPRTYKKLEGAARAQGITKDDLNMALDNTVKAPTYKTPKPIAEREKAIGKATGEILRSMDLSAEERVKMNGALRGAMAAENRKTQQMAIMTGGAVDSVADLKARVQLVAQEAIKKESPSLAIKEHTTALRTDTAMKKQEWNTEQVRARAADKSVEQDAPDR